MFVLCALLLATPGDARVGDDAFVPSPRTRFPRLIGGGASTPADSVELVVRVDAEGVVQSVTAPTDVAPSSAAPAIAAMREARFVPAVADGLARDAAVRLRETARPNDRRPPGSLPMEAIRKAIRAHAAEYRGCYEAELRADPTDPTGVLKLHFRIDPDGQVGGAVVLPGELGDRPVLARCVLDAAMGWRFPPVPSGGIVIVVYPFRFQVTP
jgi:outer membrane biosynthesis protein TonB